MNKQIDNKDHMKHLWKKIERFKRIQKYYEKELRENPGNINDRLKEWWIKFCNKVYGYHQNRMEGIVGTPAEGPMLGITYWIPNSELEHIIWGRKNYWLQKYSDEIYLDKVSLNIKQDLELMYLKEIHFIKQNSFIVTCLKLEEAEYDLDFPLDIWLEK